MEHSVGIHIFREIAITNQNLVLKLQHFMENLKTNSFFEKTIDRNIHNFFLVNANYVLQ